MKRLALLCLLGLGCMTKHPRVLLAIDSGTGGSGGPEAGADLVTDGAAPGCEAQPANIDADSGAVTLDCRCNISDRALVPIYDSASGAVSTCTFALPRYDHATIEFAIYFNDSLIGVSGAYSADFTVSADGTEITLTGSYCTDIQNGAPSRVQALFGCIVPPLGGP
jgi:hypothetical protein